MSHPVLDVAEVGVRGFELHDPAADLPGVRLAHELQPTERRRQLANTEIYPKDAEEPGGATTRDLWGGEEFGSNKFKQFPIWSGSQGRGSRGWFIYPTLRRLQPEIIQRWETAFDQILKEW